MRLPRALARFNRRVTNPVQRRGAGMLPGFGIVEHVGRRSGRAYRTPVNVFACDGGFAVLLFYGAGTDWLRNVQAAGAAVLVHRRRRYTISAPQVAQPGPARRASEPARVRAGARQARRDDSQDSART